MKKNKTQDRSQGRSRMWMGSIMAALVAALALFAVMLQLEKKVLSEYEKGLVYVASKEIPKGIFLTEYNRAEYMQSVELDVKLIPSKAILDVAQCKELVVRETIDAGAILTEGMFETVDEITESMENPVIAGFKAEDLYQVVGGVLRSGDRIGIYTVSENAGARLVWDNIFVQQVFDGSGKAIAGGDHTSAAQRINVYLDAADVERFYTELAGGMLRVVKVCE